MEDVGVVLHYELKGTYSTQINISSERIKEFLDKRGNPFQSVVTAPLHNFSTGEMVPQKVTGRLIRFFNNG